MKKDGTTNRIMDYNNTPINWLKVNNIVQNANRIILTTHENPDGDGIGTESGMFYYLKALHKEIRIINYSPLPSEFNYLNKDSIFECYNKDIHDSWIKDTDLVIIFDVGDFSRLRALGEVIQKYNIDTMNIDHHPHLDTHNFTYNLVDLNASATGCMIYDYIKSASQSNEIAKDSLEGIYTAVMTDTGCFRYSNTNDKCHQIAIEALNKNVETHKIYQHIYENSSKSRMDLMGQFLSNLKYELNGKLAWFLITQDMMSSSNANKSDVEGFSDIVRTIRGVEVSLMIFQTGNHSCRINFRSKGKITINDIAQSFGGGGHAYASGAMIDGELSKTIDNVISKTIISVEKKLKETGL